MRHVTELTRCKIQKQSYQRDRSNSYKLRFRKNISCFVFRTDDTDRVFTTAIATALVDHADVLLTHGARYYDI